MKKYPYKFTTTVKVLFVAGLILAVAVIAVNVVRFSLSSERTTYSYITLILTVTVAAAALILGVWIFASSYFTVDEKNLTLKWGPLKNTVPTDSIRKIVHLEKSGKLIVYYGDNEDYFVVFIRSGFFDEFSRELMSKNKNVSIEYTDG